MTLLSPETLLSKKTVLYYSMVYSNLQVGFACKILSLFLMEVLLSEVRFTRLVKYLAKFLRTKFALSSDFVQTLVLAKCSTYLSR